MNTRLAANLSLLCMSSMLILCFSFGFNNYVRTQKAIVADLNHALQQTIMANSNLWMNADTLETYSRLSVLFGNPVSIESYNKEFAEALRFEKLSKQSGIIIQVMNKKAKTEESPLPLASKDLSDNYLASDTILWISGDMNLQNTVNAQISDIGLSFQGYTNCSSFTIIQMMNKGWSTVCLLFAFLSGCTYLYIRKQICPTLAIIEDEEEKGKTISFGNITLSCDKSSFYKEDQDKLKLTPQQYAVMEMFFLSSTHILSRSEICDALWPGKINADETLNTLVRRLRPLIEENSNLKITTDRGRAYALEIQ